jgi:hypothetical protein
MDQGLKFHPFEKANTVAYTLEIQSTPHDLWDENHEQHEANYHVTHNFNNNMSTATVFLNIQKAFDTTWYSGLLYKLSELEFSTSLIKLIGSFL